MIYKILKKYRENLLTRQEASEALTDYVWELSDTGYISPRQAYDGEQLIYKWYKEEMDALNLERELIGLGI